MLPDMKELINTVEGWFGQNPIYDGLISSALLLVFAGLFFFAIRLAISRGIRRLIRKTETHWDDALYDAGFFYRLTLVVPILVVRQGLDFIPHLPESAHSLLARIAMALAIVVAVQVAIALLNAAGTIYRTTAGASRHSIKGYLQIGQILVVGVGVVLTLAVLMDRSPLVFLGGMGAMTAVLMLVFKDTILGFVASVQIATNDMLRVGDWIEMPSAGADGDVLDIALYTAKVQNWDKTITTIPTYMLIQESFRNWRGMSESGGRRIKRSLWFDVNTIRFLEKDEIRRFSGYALLREYIEAKTAELETYNAQSGLDPLIKADTRRLTNIGTLRAYIERYLQSHPKIHQDMTLLVRQLQPTSDGLPVEIYCFTTTTDWNAYEAIQADIFDHVLALLPEFGLRVFQNESDYAQSNSSATAGSGEG